MRSFCGALKSLLLTRPFAGKRPPRKKEDLPKATEFMKARDVPLNLDKNLNKTIVIDASAGSGQKQPGFYCDVCKRTCKDSARYLDHINGRSRTLCFPFAMIALPRLTGSRTPLLSLMPFVSSDLFPSFSPASQTCDDWGRRPRWSVPR